MACVHGRARWKAAGSAGWLWLILVDFLHPHTYATPCGLELNLSVRTQSEILKQMCNIDVRKCTSGTPSPTLLDRLLIKPAAISGFHPLEKVQILS